MPTVASDNLRALAAMCCIGKTTAEMLVESGVPNPAALRRLGAIGAYRRLRFQFGKRVRTSFAYALECAIRGMEWRNLKAERADDLRREALAVVRDLEGMTRPKR